MDIRDLVERLVKENINATVKDVVEEVLSSSGVEEASGVEVETLDGATTEAQTTEHSIMGLPAGQIVSVKIKQTAEGGC